MPAEAIDSHAHLYFDRFNDDRDEVIERSKDAGFVAIINIAVDEETSRWSLVALERMLAIH
jgi:Tat protein secretion system quality control protein TatD with DNase activity